MNFRIDKEFYRVRPGIDGNERVETKDRTTKTKKMESMKIYIVLLD
jgi:hypothetical protein